MEQWGLSRVGKWRGHFDERSDSTNSLTTREPWTTMDGLFYGVFSFFLSGRQACRKLAKTFRPLFAIIKLPYRWSWLSMSLGSPTRFVYILAVGFGGV